MRNIVNRADGRRIHVARILGQLFVCADGCCCGRVQDGYAPVPRDLYHREWERRELRNRVHLTIGGCLGPCALANVVLLLFDGQTQWFHSIDSEAQALALYDHVERMLEADGCLPPPAGLAPEEPLVPDAHPARTARAATAVRAFTTAVRCVTETPVVSGGNQYCPGQSAIGRGQAGLPRTAGRQAGQR